MLALLYKQSKLWFALLFMIVTVIAASAGFAASYSQNQDKASSGANPKVDLSGRYSDLDLSTDPESNEAGNTSSLPPGINREDLLSLIRPDQGCPRLQPTLYDMTLQNYQERYALAHNIILTNNKVRVILVVSAPTTSVPTGYLIETKSRNKQNVIADVPVYMLCSLANEKEIDQIRIPTPGELLDISDQTGSIGVSDLLNKAKAGYTPTSQDFKKYNIDPQLFYDLLKKINQSDIKTTQNQ